MTMACMATSNFYEWNLPKNFLRFLARRVYIIDNATCSWYTTDSRFQLRARNLRTVFIKKIELRWSYHSRSLIHQCWWKIQDWEPNLKWFALWNLKDWQHKYRVSHSIRHPIGWSLDLTAWEEPTSPRRSTSTLKRNPASFFRAGSPARTLILSMSDCTPSPKLVELSSRTSGHRPISSW